LPVKK